MTGGMRRPFRVFGEIRRLLDLTAGDMPLRRVTLSESMTDYWHERAKVDFGLERRKARIARRMEAVADEIQDGESVLELGCGSGDLLDVIRRRRPRCRIRGVDLSQEALDAARARGFDVERADLMAMGPDDLDSADVVVLSEVLEHLPDPERVMSICRNIASRRIIVTIPNVAFFLHRIRLGLFGKFPVTTVFHIREHLSLWSVKDFEFWAGALGLEVVSQRSLGGVGAFGLQERWPNLFANQVLFVLRRRDTEVGA